MIRRNILVLGLLAIFGSTKIASPRLLQAATIPIGNMQLGQVIQIGSRQFVKIKADGLFMAMQTPIKTMQEFTSTDCNSFSTPSGTNYTAVGTLMDSRDGKSYEIRKFADGKCWMVDNLRYGGGTDGSSDYCAGRIDFRQANTAASTTAIATNGLNPTNGSRNTLVGDCRDGAVSQCISHCGVANYCTDGSLRCGYYYNWAAAIQDARGYEGNSFVPTEPVTGLCPQGWHLPSTQEYQTLKNNGVTNWQIVAAGWGSVDGRNDAWLGSGSTWGVGQFVTYYTASGITTNTGAINARAAGSFCGYTNTSYGAGCGYRKSVGGTVRCVI